MAAQLHAHRVTQRGQFHREMVKPTIWTLQQIALLRVAFAEEE